MDGACLVGGLASWKGLDTAGGVWGLASWDRPCLVGDGAWLVGMGPGLL